MNYAIVGAGNVGKALAKAFARKGMAVKISSRKTAAELAPVAEAIGSSVSPTSLEGALKAEVILLAVPFWTHKDLAKAGGDWNGKIVIDVTNSYGITPEELGGLPSSVVIANALSGAKVVKAFNSLLAETLAQDPKVEGGRRVVFLSGDDDDAVTQVKALVDQLGFAPVPLGKLGEGGLLIQAKGNAWAPLIALDLIKPEA